MTPTSYQKLQSPEMRKDIADLAKAVRAKKLVPVEELHRQVEPIALSADVTAGVVLNLIWYYYTKRLRNRPVLSTPSYRRLQEFHDRIEVQPG